MKLIKKIIRYGLYWLKRKPYKIKTYGSVKLIPMRSDSEKEYFFGYYDKFPEVNKKVVFQEMNDGFVNIIVKDLENESETIVGQSKAYNWQLGARIVWVDKDIVSFNDFEDGQYVSRWVSIVDNKIIKTIPMPAMDIWKDEYILTTNYQRLRTINPDYSYSCLPEMDDTIFNDYEHDGIWMYNIKTDNKKLLVSLSDILKCKSSLLYEDGKHCVNHIMISPNGKSFIFIHRYKYNGRKYDRLMYYDFNILKCLLDDPVQSHFCWLDSENIMGYCEYGNKIGWYAANTHTNVINKMEQLTNLHPMNGHPSPYGDWIVVDCYPALNRMQTLQAYNNANGEMVLLADFFHDIRHSGYNRCDLHPRISSDGKSVYVDTIYKGKRQLCKLTIDLQ